MNFKDRVIAIWESISPWEKKDAQPYTPPVLTERTEEQRRELLTRYVAGEVARGGRVQLHTNFDAVLEFGRRPNHILHFLLCIPTLGFWIFMWILLAMTMKISTRKYYVDEYGQIVVS